MTKVQVQMDENLAKNFATLCESNGLNQEHVINQLIGRYVSQNPVDMTSHLSDKNFQSLEEMRVDGLTEHDEF